MEKIEITKDNIWDIVPDWGEWIAFSNSGSLCVFSKRPDIREGDWQQSPFPHYGLALGVKFTPWFADWQDSLIQRPSGLDLLHKRIAEYNKWQGKLCWFWNAEEDMPTLGKCHTKSGAHVKVLLRINSGAPYGYIFESHDCASPYCRPLTVDEVLKLVVMKEDDE